MVKFLLKNKTSLYSSFVFSALVITMGTDLMGSSLAMDTPTITIDFNKIINKNIAIPGKTLTESRQLCWDVFSKSLTEESIRPQKKTDYILGMAKMVIQDGFCPADKTADEIHENMSERLKDIYNSTNKDLKATYRGYAMIWEALHKMRKQKICADTTENAPHLTQAWKLLMDASHLTQTQSINFYLADLIINYHYYPEAMTKKQAFELAGALLAKTDSNHPYKPDFFFRGIKKNPKQ
jgi:hypothetical protein